MRRRKGNNINNILFLLFLGWGALFISPACVLADGNRAETLPSVPAGNVVSCESSQRIPDGIEALVIYRISNGKADSITIAGEELRGIKSISVDGYVCGIVVLCDPNVRVSVDGREPHPVNRNADGTFWIQNYGKAAFEDVALPGHRRSCDSDSSPCGGVNRESERNTASGYSLFPDVFGNSLSLASQFDITFESEDEISRLLIQHKGSLTLARSEAESESHADGLVFRYLGTRLDQIEQRAADLEDRLKAIEEGIESVESVFGAGLVEAVNVIDYEGVKDAVVCDGTNDIWIYVDALLGEPLKELKTIAAHETLHVLVDKNMFARDSEVRELFARLRGYDEFSPERFSIVISGIAPPCKPEQCPESGAFFAFINERNFIEGMKGGHSHDTVEDFSTSFLHSLMFLDRFEPNLNRPVLFSEEAGGSRPLTAQERDFVVDSYLNAIGTFLHALDSNCENGSITRAFLQNKRSILMSSEKNREPQS